MFDLAMSNSECVFACMSLFSGVAGGNPPNAILTEEIFGFKCNLHALDCCVVVALSDQVVLQQHEDDSVMSLAAC